MIKYDCLTNSVYSGIDSDISYICEWDYEGFFTKPNVVGVALGYKYTNGVCTGKKCITVFVTSKIPSCNLHPLNLIPKCYKGIDTDVIESGSFRTAIFNKRIRPAIGGYSIGDSINSGVGTLGCLVTDGTDRFVLSCNHVLANFNKNPIGTSIIQPGLFDGGKPQTDVIATLSKFIPLKFKIIFFTPDNYVDCAMAKLVDSNIADPRIALLGPPQGTAPAELGKGVWKVGRTTELTKGKVTNISGTITVDSPAGTFLLKDQIFSDVRCEEGDSGAVLLNLNYQAVGLLSGVANNIAYFNNITRVLQSLNVTLVTS